MPGHLGPETDSLIAIDGKHVRRSGGLAIASAVDEPSQRVHATVTLQTHDSEINDRTSACPRTNPACAASPHPFTSERFLHPPWLSWLS